MPDPDMAHSGARPGPDPEQFDEAYYLAANPDVAAVVEAGFIPSGWFHYEAHGHGEGRFGTPTDDQVFGPWPDAPPLPEYGTLDEGLLAEKGRIEVAMRGSPRNLGLREGYFDVLWMISGSHFGAFFANLPELRTPLMFRGGSSDVLNMRQIYIDNWVGAHDFQYGDYAVPLPTPRRILDLGAYCGYTAVYFANRFPDAEIIAVEPSVSNFAVLKANVAPYPNIECINAAIWHRPTRVAATAHKFGDWGAQFDASAVSEQDTLPGHTIPEIMAMHGWDHVDFIKCILEGEQVPVLAAEDRPWFDKVTCVATKPSPAGSFPRRTDEDRLRKAFARPRFDTFRHAEMFFFIRREPAPAPAVPVLRLAPPPPTHRRYCQEHVEGALVFHRFGESGIHLAPNPPGSPECRIVFTVHVAGQTRFESGIVAHPSDGGTVTFGVVIEDASTNEILHAEQRTLPVDTQADWAFEFAPLQGVCVVTLSTAREGQEDHVGADFLDPRLR